MSTRQLIVVASAFALAACTADSITPPREPSADLRAVHQPQWVLADATQPTPMLGGLRVNVTPRFAAVQATIPDTQKIRYHGGPIATTALNVVAVYWSTQRIFKSGPLPGTAGAGTDDHSLVGFFLRKLGASPYYGINTTYKNGTGTPVAHGLNYTGFVAVNDAPAVLPLHVSENTVVNKLLSLFNDNTLQFDPHTLYIVFGGPKADIGNAYGAGACAYHTWSHVSNGTPVTLLWAAMPYGASLSGCHIPAAQWSPPNADLGADAQVSILAHEIEETATDEIGTGYYDASGDENADKCAWYFGPLLTSVAGGGYNITVGGKPFLVQMNWARTGGCKTHL